MRFLILATVALLIGCAAPIESQQLAAGSYRLRYEHSWHDPGEVGRAAMLQEASRLCPDGFERVRERVSGNDVSGSSEMTIRCD